MNTAADVIANRAQWSVIQGDCVAGMRTLPDGCVHCVVTSPPYFALRAYLPAGHADKPLEVGTEDTPEKYVARMVGVFREVRRIMRDDGTLWLNVGDSYATPGTRQGNRGSTLGKDREDTYRQFYQKTPEGFKNKDLIGIPWMLAFALRADGWYLRAEIIWHKPSPMPSSVRDRPTTAHEQVFLLAKEPRYFYDAEAIAEKAKRAGDTAGGRKYRSEEFQRAGFGRHSDSLAGAVAETANKRSVWRIASRSYKGAHFATYPPKLVEPCVLAGTSAKGVCLACGAPWAREVKKDRRATRPGDGSKVVKLRKDSATDIPGSPMYRNGSHNSGLAAMVGNRDPERHVTTTETTGWNPSCECDAGEPIGAIVFDPFAGSGTTLAVAVEHGRRGLGTELNADYLTLIEKRMNNFTPNLFSEAT